MTGDVVLEIPFQEIEVKSVNGAREKVLEMRGFVTARWGDGDAQLISNPLIEWAHTGSAPAAAHATSNLGNIRIFLKLVPANTSSNPGLDDEQASLIYDNYRL